MEKITLLILFCTTTFFVEAQTFDFKTEGTALGWTFTGATVTSTVGVGLEISWGDGAQPKLIHKSAGIDADTNNFINITIKNPSTDFDKIFMKYLRANDTVYRFTALEPIATQNSNFLTYQFDLTHSTWAGTMNDLDYLAFRTDSGSGGVTTAGSVVIEKIEFTNTRLIYVLEVGGAWVPIAPTNGQSVNLFSDYTVSSHLTLNDVIVKSTGSLTVQAGVGLTLNNLTVDAGSTVSLESTSTSYSSIIASSVSNSGTINYERYTNIIGTGVSGGNDLVSPPLSGQAFNDFTTANSGTLATNGAAAAFAPYNNNTPAYENYATAATTALVAGKGYRAATTSGGVLIYDGTVNTNQVDIAITDDTSNWNLIGNPYPSYIKLANFLSRNGSLFDGSSSGVYGYDGASGWTIWNQAYSDENSTALITPGQGFFVNSKIGGGTVSFTPAMRSTGSSDDFITEKSNTSKVSSIYNLKLQLVSGSKLYKTDFYFTDNASLGLDAGYDATVYEGSAPSFAVYSHLVEDNIGLDMGIQSLSLQDLENVTIPLGINASSGEEFTLSIGSSTLQAGIYVYLKDHVANELTLLNDLDFSYTPSKDLTSTGQFSIILSTSQVLAVEEIKAQNGLEIYTSFSEKTLYINGILTDVTSVQLFDIQGRKILSRILNKNNSSNRIDLSNLNTGIYIVQVSSNSIKQSKKVIVK